MRKRITFTLFAAGFALALAGAGPADTWAKGPDKAEKAAKGAVGKNKKTKTVDKGRGGKPEHPAKEGGREDAGGNGRAAKDGDGRRGRWAGWWNAEDLLEAGFDTAALMELLGGDRSALHTGAKPLPPGIRKNLARGKPLPPGIAKRYASPDLDAVLPRVDGHEWLEAGRDLVLVTIGTAVIKQILKDVLS